MKTFTQAFEILGPVAVKTLALIAGIAVFVPLLVAYAAPFFG